MRLVMHDNMPVRWLCWWCPSDRDGEMGEILRGDLGGTLINILELWSRVSTDTLPAMAKGDAREVLLELLRAVLNGTVEHSRYRLKTV